MTNGWSLFQKVQVKRSCLVVPRSCQVVPVAVCGVTCCTPSREFLRPSARSRHTQALGEARLLNCGLATNRLRDRVPQDRLLRVVDKEGLGTRSRTPVGGAIVSMYGARGELGDVVHRMRGQPSW